MIKKSAIDLTDLALGIVILGIIASIGAVILINMRDAQLTNLDQSTITNETLTTVDETGATLTQTFANGVTSCVNATEGQTVPTSNYTVSIDSSGYATVTTVASSGEFNGTDWQCTYNVYNQTDPRYALANDAAAGISEYGNWFDIIVIVGIAGLILALIFMAFGRRGETGQTY